MALYQAVAEEGPSYCKGPEKLTECGDDLADLPRADGIVFADAHPGNSINTLRGLNPAVANENNPPDAPLIPELNPFDPKNGFNPNGPSNYSADFQARYFKAQADRMNRLIEGARDKLERMQRKVELLERRSEQLQDEIEARSSELERLEAESTGLTKDRVYMADLECERADYQQALVIAAIEEVLALRSELSWRQFG